MSWLNKSNKSNKSSVANKSDLAELDLAGQSSSLMLTEALETAARALDVAIATPCSVQIKTGTPNYLKLNERHLNEALATELWGVVPAVDDLIKQVDRAPGTNPTSKVVLKYTPAQWTGQLEALRVLRYSRSKRLAEIYLQQTDLISFLAQPIGISSETHPRLIQLLEAAWTVAFRISVQLKLKFSTPRPIQLAPDMAPVIQTPAHSSFPAGHAIEAQVLAMIMSHFFPDAKAMLDRAADRVGQNRLYAGVHFPVDVSWGKACGAYLGEKLISRINQGSAYPALHVISAAAKAEC